MPRASLTPKQQSPAKARVIIVERIEDPQAEYERLKELSVLPLNQLFDRYELQTRMEQATSNGHQSRVLYLQAMRELERYKKSVAKELADIRYTALRRLSAKQRMDKTSSRKFMTERDADDYIFIDDELRERYAAVDSQITDGQLAVDVLKSLADAWRERVYVLQAMASALPKVHKDE